ncbi:MAG: arginine deiminase family protein [Chloroflexota bacterium]
MTKNYGSQSMVAPLQTVLVKRPSHAFGSADPEKWHYVESGRSCPQPKTNTMPRHNLLRAEGIEVVYHDVELPDHADAIFVHDPSIVTNDGAIILQMGKDLRRGEEGASTAVYQKLGIPIHYQLHGEARAEGGDLLWLDEKTLAVGQGFRTNAAGLAQLRSRARRRRNHPRAAAVLRRRSGLPTFDVVHQRGG